MAQDRITKASIIKETYEDGKEYYLIDFEWIHYRFGIFTSKRNEREYIKFKTQEEAQFYIDHIWRPSKYWGYSDDFGFYNGRYVYPIVNGNCITIDTYQPYKDYPYFKSKSGFDSFIKYYKSVSKEEEILTKINL